jgi:hypothetical protein
MFLLSQEIILMDTYSQNFPNHVLAKVFKTKRYILKEFFFRFFKENIKNNSSQKCSVNVIF